MSDKKYTEEEMRKLLAAAFVECSLIMIGACSYTNAQKRMLDRGREIEAGGPLTPPPGGNRA